MRFVSNVGAPKIVSLLKQYFFRGLSRSSKSGTRDRFLMGNRIALDGEEIMTRLKDPAQFLRHLAETFVKFAQFSLPSLIVILTSRVRHAITAPLPLDYTVA